MRDHPMQAPGSAATGAIVPLCLALVLGWGEPASATGNEGSFSAATGALTRYAATPIVAHGQTCASLRGFQAGLGHVVDAEEVEASATAPAYCRVVGVIPERVRFLIYLPVHWNGRLYMHGNGGDGGEALDHAPYHALRINALRHGFAAVYTDTGHDARSSPGAVWAHDNPGAEEDYGYRAVHESIVAARAAATHHYGVPPARAYFDGCSTGGRQGLVEAQRYPEDFDGILVGAPVLDLPDMLWQYQRNALAIEGNPISPEALARLGDFMREKFDRLDGVEDNVIGDPLAVDFVPSRDLPRAPAAGGFTDGELATLDLIYAPVVVAGRTLVPRTVTGAELVGQVHADQDRESTRQASAWVGRVVPDENGFMAAPAIVETWFRYLAFDRDDPARDWRTMNPGRDLAAMTRMRTVLAATNPELGPFARRGGRLIIYHGWADFGVSPLRTLDYVRSVRRQLGPGADDMLRLYLVPGMFHCHGGTNVDYFDLMSPLVDWVEQGKAPGAIPAARIEEGHRTRSRPLCPHPGVAVFRGRGDPDQADSFTCTVPRRKGTF